MLMLVPVLIQEVLIFKEKISDIAENAVADACTGSNPRSIDPKTMEKLFTCIYYGTEVDF